ncbi:MAG: NADH-quinone oxidoreductase subunit NuoH [Anaerolineae bacterium]|nr:MAG: NADH-quinone oxidoreductase subunit NuoH [Anaerolineae bacterium]
MNETLLLILEWTIKGGLLAFVLATGFAYTTFYERKWAARLQIRIGPNRTGPGGWLQPAADGVKLFFKEEFTPANAYKLAFNLAPILTMVPAIVIMAVIPWGSEIELFGRIIPLGISNELNVGVLFLLSVASISVYGIVLAGWSSNNKYAMLGGLRSTAQMISYELALGLSFVGPIMLAGSLNLADIVRAQMAAGGWFFTKWYVIYLPLAAVVFYIAALAEVNRSPFDMPEAEQELTAGYHTEYSGMKFSLFFMGEYIKMIAVSAICATLFFGGYDGPFVDSYPLLGPLYLGIKIFISLGLMIWIRAAMPRLRYDRLMSFGWKVMLPLSLLNVVWAAAVIIFFNAG